MRFFTAFDLLGGATVATGLATALTAETAMPLRPRRRTRRARWPVNAGFGALAAIFVRGAIVPAMSACSRWAAKRRFGVLRWLPIPAPMRAALGFLALDYTMYLWHRALHDVPALWRFHSVHHADVDLDASTALRFHVVELAASLPFRCAQVSLLGVSRRVVLTYEIAMQTAAVFHHSNTRLPRWLDRGLRFVVVTPRMHGVHHSADASERQSNWGVLSSFWDRLHGTHQTTATQPVIGL